MKKSDKLTRKDVGLIEAFVKNEKYIYWIFLPPLVLFHTFAAASFFGTAGLAERTGIPSMFVTAFGTDYENTKMYSGAVLRVSRNLVHFPYCTFLVVIDLSLYILVFRFRTAVRKMWKIVEAKEAAYRKKLDETGAAKSESSKSEESKTKE